MFMVIPLAIVIVFMADKITSLENQQYNLMSGLCDWSGNGDTPSELSMCDTITGRTNTHLVCHSDILCDVENN